MLGACSYDYLYGIAYLSCADDHVLMIHVINTINTIRISLYYIKLCLMSWEINNLALRDLHGRVACADSLVIILHLLSTYYTSRITQIDEILVEIL